MTMPRARTEAIQQQIELIACAWIGCGRLFAPKYPGQKFHSGPCRAAYSREHGIRIKLTSSRRLKRSVKLAGVTDNFAALDLPIDGEYMLVKVPR